jgi:transposase-like protein
VRGFLSFTSFILIINLVKSINYHEHAEKETNAEEVEVLEKATRRRYSVKDKRRILREADACDQPGEIGALLRREGLYSSTITRWRRQRENGEITGIVSKKRGPAPREKNPLESKVATLERENVRLKARAARAEALVELQKKVSEILGVELSRQAEMA